MANSASTAMLLKQIRTLITLLLQKDRISTMHFAISILVLVTVVGNIKGAFSFTNTDKVSGLKTLFRICYSRKY
jgi:hypothetical protein